jgi:hypothetical protein
MVDYKDIAAQFGSALTKKNFALAHSMLCQSLQEKLSPENLKQEFESMISYGEGLSENGDVIEAFEDWPAKRKMISAEHMLPLQVKISQKRFHSLLMMKMAKLVLGKLSGEDHRNKPRIVWP